MRVPGSPKVFSIAIRDPVADNVLQVISLVGSDYPQESCPEIPGRVLFEHPGVSVRSAAADSLRFYNKDTARDILTRVLKQEHNERVRLAIMSSAATLRDGRAVPDRGSPKDMSRQGAENYIQQWGKEQVQYNIKYNINPEDRESPDLDRTKEGVLLCEPCEDPVQDHGEPCHNEDKGIEKEEKRRDWNRDGDAYHKAGCIGRKYLSVTPRPTGVRPGTDRPMMDFMIVPKNIRSSIPWISFLG